MLRQVIALCSLLLIAGTGVCVGAPQALTTVRMRVIVPPTTSVTEQASLRASIAEQAKFANLTWSQAGIRFDVDSAVSVDAGLLDAKGAVDCSDATLGTLGDRYVGVMAAFACGPEGDASDSAHNALRFWPGGPPNVLHEAGHYFSLQHVFSGANFDLALRDDLAPAITNPSLTTAQRTALFASLMETTFDGDGLSDTPPSAQTGIPLELLYPPTSIEDTCAPTYVGRLPFTLARGEMFYGDFAPDRTNIMSYFKWCGGSVRGQFRISPMQVARIQSHLHGGGGKHLLGPALHWSAWGQVAGSSGHAIATAVLGSRLYLVATGSGADHGIYASSALAGQPFSAWTAIGGATDAAVSAVNFDSRLYLFAKGNGTDHKIYFNAALAGQPFIGWNPTGGSTDASFGAGAFPTKLFLFAKGDGSDHAVYFNSALPQHGFVGWSPAGGSTNAPVAATVSDDKLYVFARSDTNSSYYVNVAPSQQPFSGWTGMPNQLAVGVAPVGAMAATSFGGRLYVAARGSDNRVYFNSALAQQPFGSWYEIPGGMLTNDAPSMTVFDNRLFVVVKQPTGQIEVTSAVELSP